MSNITELFGNETDDLASDYAPYVIPYWRQILWTILFYVIAVVGAVGNFTIVWIVVAHRNMRSVTNLFLVNLAIADGLVAALDVPFVSFQMIYGYWPFGYFVCKTNEFFAATNIGVSVLTLSMISIDRYQAIMYPFKRRMGRGKTITIMICIWLVSVLILSPNWIYVTIFENVYGSDVDVCGQMWPDENIQEIFRISMMIVLYFVPLACIGFSYGSMAIKLWGHETIGEQSQKQMKNKRATKRIVKMLIAVVSIFSICWLPFHIMFIMSATDLLVSVPPEYMREVFMFFFWLAMSNSMYNPIIYCLMNARFRAGFKKTFRWCPCIHYDPALDAIHFSSTTTTIRRSLTETE